MTMSAQSSHFKEIRRINAVFLSSRPSNKTHGVLLATTDFSDMGAFIKRRTSLAETAKFSPSAPVVLNEFTPTSSPSSERSGPPGIAGIDWCLCLNHCSAMLNVLRAGFPFVIGSNLAYDAGRKCPCLPGRMTNCVNVCANLDAVLWINFDALNKSRWQRVGLQ